MSDSNELRTDCRTILLRPKQQCVQLADQVTFSRSFWTAQGDRMCLTAGLRLDDHDSTSEVCTMCLDRGEHIGAERRDTVSPNGIPDLSSQSIHELCCRELRIDMPQVLDRLANDNLVRCYRETSVRRVALRAFDVDERQRRVAVLLEMDKIGDFQRAIIRC